MGEVHDLLLEHGTAVARAYAHGRRGPRVVEAASRWLSDEDISTGFVYSGWCQTGLPLPRPRISRGWRPTPSLSPEGNAGAWSCYHRAEKGDPREQVVSWNRRTADISFSGARKLRR